MAKNEQEGDNAEALRLYTKAVRLVLASSQPVRLPVFHGVISVVKWTFGGQGGAGNENDLGAQHSLYQLSMLIVFVSLV